ncbi:MAG: UvrD-helicase domain-containing protein [Solirubrobacteraceae bacterium]
MRLLGEHPHRLAYYRQRWRWLVIDEFQDTNEAQSMLIALLAGPSGNVCAVADDDQLVYSFRGAEPRNVLAFGERFPGHARIVLGRNFRCRAEILDAAVACVSHN